MSRVRLLFSEAWSSITANLSTTFAATMTVLIGMFILGLFIALGTWVLSWSDHIKRELQVKVYFTTAASDSQEVAVGRALKNQFEHVKKVTFVSKEQAFKEQSRKYPDLYKHVVSNPLPDAYIVTPVKGEYTPDIGRAVSAKHFDGVDEVNWGSSTAKRVLTIAEVIWIVFLIFVVLLVVASTLLIANTIRLSIFARSSSGRRTGSSAGRSCSRGSSAA
jgi:cell division transport system permease protein